jgi:hypothetical protein
MASLSSPCSCCRRRCSAFGRIVVGLLVIGFALSLLLIVGRGRVLAWL